MTRLSDFIQILLSLESPLNFLSALVLIVIFLQCWKYTRRALKLVWMGVKWVWEGRLRITAGRLTVWCCLAGLACAFSEPISDSLQWAEQRYLKPAYVIEYDTTIAGDAYEAEMMRHLSSREAEVFKQRIAEIAAKYGSTQLAMYEVGFSECGLNPFAFNKDWNEKQMRWDTVAAGFIQFTAIGLQGCVLDGQPVTMRMAKDWCLTRNLERIMALTDAYFEAVCKGRALPRPIDVYVAVFAPAFIGAGDEQVLYDRRTWEAAYTQNIGFDGYFVEALPNGKKIIRQTIGARDGNISIHDVRLHLERKKALLVGAWVRNKQ